MTLPWKEGDYVALMERQILSVECHPDLEAKARAFFGDKVRVIKDSQPGFWAIVTRTNPFIEADAANRP